ncbi:MAG: hypothetical protein GY820_09525 [Gammaproteobacteria bacterium]|nr:hypothetical protein [Gammaproteobacteria bacterium]
MGLSHFRLDNAVYNNNPNSFSSHPIKKEPAIHNDRKDILGNNDNNPFRIMPNFLNDPVNRQTTPEKKKKHNSRKRRRQFEEKKSNNEPNEKKRKVCVQTPPTN